MSHQRILRSSKKVLPDVVPVTSHSSRKILFGTSGDLSNTPKESENENELPKKKPKKKTIRRTQNSFYIENESRTDANGLIMKQSNAKTSKTSTKKNGFIVKFEEPFDGDSDSASEKGLSSTKTLRTKKSLRLPRVELDDFPQPDHIRKVTKELYSNKGLKSRRHNLASTVDICSDKDKDEKIANKNKSNSRLSGTSNDHVNEYRTSDESDLENEQPRTSKSVRKRIRHSSRRAQQNTNLSYEIKTEKPTVFSSTQNFVASKRPKSSTSQADEDVKHISVHISSSSSDSEIEFNCCPKDPLESISDFSVTTSNNKVSIQQEDYVNDISMNNILVETKFDSNTDNRRGHNISMNLTTMKSRDHFNENREMISLTKKNDIGLLGRERKRWTILEGTEARKSFHLQIENLRKSLLMQKKNHDTAQENLLLKPRRSARKRWSDELRKTVSALDVSVDCKNDCKFEADNMVTDETVLDLEDNNRISKSSRRSRSLISLENSPNEPDFCEMQSSGTIISEPNMSNVSSKEETFNTKISLKSDVNDSDTEWIKSRTPSKNKRLSRSLVSLKSSPNEPDFSEKQNSRACVGISESNTSIKGEQCNGNISFKINISDSDRECTKSPTPSNKKMVSRSRSLSHTSKRSSSRKSSTHRATPFVRKSKAGLRVDVNLDQPTYMEKDSVNICKNKNDYLKSHDSSNNLNNSTLEPTSKDQTVASSRRSELYTTNVDASLQLQKQNMDDTFDIEESINDIALLKSNSIMPSTSMMRSGSPNSASNNISNFMAFSNMSTTLVTETTPYNRKSNADISINDLSYPSQNSTKRRTIEIEKIENDISLSRSTAKRQLHSTRRSSPLADTLDSPKRRSYKSFRATPHVRKSRPNLPVDATDNSKIQITGEDFEMENTTNDIDLVFSSSIRRSTSLTDTMDIISPRPTSNISKSSLNLSTNAGRSDSSTSALNNISNFMAFSNMPTTLVTETKLHARKPNADMPINNSSYPYQNSTKRRTFEIEKNVNDISLSRSTAKRQSSSNGRSSSLADTLDSPKKKSLKSFRATPHVRKSRPNLYVDDATDYSKIQINGEDCEIENTTNYCDLVFSSSIRRSTSLTDTTDIISPRPTSNISKSSLNLSSNTGNLASHGSILKRRATYELNESVTDINLLKSLSENTLTDIGVGVLSDNSSSFNISKKVRFANVTTRKVWKRTDREAEVDEGENEQHNKVAAVTKKVSFKKSIGTYRSVSFDQTIFSPPSSSSTPKFSSQKSTLQSSKKDINNTLYGRRRSRSADEGNTKIARKRMPNFAKIHERARERMENIVKFTERKAERARLLLSGQKPVDSSNCSNSNNTQENGAKQSHKQLNFNSSQPSTSRGFLRVIQKSPKNKQLIKEPKKLIDANSTKNNRTAEDTKITMSNKIKPGLHKAGFLNVAIPEAARNTKRTLPPKSIGPNKVTRFGFKIKNDAGAENKAEEIKALASKTKLPQDNRVERRIVLKGVRSNRRFDLLVKMRKN